MCHYHLAANKDKWHTKEDPCKYMKMHCKYCGVPKGTSRAEVMPNSEKIKPVALV